MRTTQTPAARRRRYDPSRDRHALDKIQAELEEIVSYFCEKKPAVRGRLTILKRRCGKERCRCTRGQLHVASVFIESPSGSRRIRTVTRAEYRALKKPTRRYLTLRRLRARVGKLHKEALASLDRLLGHQRAEGERLVGRWLEE